MANPKVGVQLNPAFGRRRFDDLDGVLGEVRAAGFDGVEAASCATATPRLPHASSTATDWCSGACIRATSHPLESTERSTTSPR